MRMDEDLLAAIESGERYRFRLICFGTGDAAQLSTPDGIEQSFMNWLEDNGVTLNDVQSVKVIDFADPDSKRYPELEIIASGRALQFLTDAYEIPLNELEAA